jgi:hypothetical protein
MIIIKSLLDYLSDLPESCREKAIANARAYQGTEFDEATATGAQDALRGAFSWKDAPEGFDYWCGVARVVDQVHLAGFDDTKALGQAVIDSEAQPSEA